MPETRANAGTGGEGPGRRTLLGSSLRLVARRPGAVALAFAALLLAVIVLQNFEPIEIDLLFWSVARVPKLVLIVVSMLVGGLTWEVARRRLFR
jgi:hypothetical protein